MDNMYALILVIAVLVAAIIIGGTAARRRKRRQAAQAEEFAKLDAWVRQVINAETDEEIAAIDAPSECWSGDEVATATQKRKCAIERLKTAERRHRETVARAEVAAIWRLPRSERVVALLRFHQDWQLDAESRAKFQRERKLFFVAYASELYAAAEQGDSQSFFRLCSLVEADYSDYRRGTYEEYRFPGGWDELMVGFVKMPSTGQFHNQSEVNTATVQVLAPQALREKNLVLAKWVLAVTRGDDAYAQSRRRAVGETFHGKLIDFVDRQHAAMEEESKVLA